MDKNKKAVLLGMTACILMISIFFAYFTVFRKDAVSANADGYIKWVEFDVPYQAMNRAMQLDVASYEEGDGSLDWIEMLSYLAVKYGGEWGRYKEKDLNALAERIKSGESMENITKDMKYYSFYQEAYTAVLGGMLGEYQTEIPAGEDGSEKMVVTKYGLKAYSPIAKNYGYSHYDDFGNSRSYGYRRRHLGNDLIGSIGTPIIAVESGVVEVAAWNQYGGWRIGIRSFDTKRYYYYAHLRKGHPFHPSVQEGAVVKAGDVIGYLGMTGYSTKENANNMTVPHLHFGLQLIFDESQKEGNNEIWVDVYEIVKLLANHTSAVVRDEATKDYNRKYLSTDIETETYIREHPAPPAETSSETG